MHTCCKVTWLEKRTLFYWTWVSDSAVYDVQYLVYKTELYVYADIVGLLVALFYIRAPPPCINTKGFLVISLEPDIYKCSSVCLIFNLSAQDGPSGRKIVASFNIDISEYAILKGSKWVYTLVELGILSSRVLVCTCSLRKCECTKVCVYVRWAPIWPAIIVNLTIQFTEFYSAY